MKKNAVVIGSFSPPHMGHLYMIDSASALAEKLTVLIYSYDNKEYNYIDGNTRFNWLSTIYKNYSNITIKLIEDIMPQTPELHGDYIDFYEIWTKDMSSRVEGEIDLVCGSEAYVEDLAKFLECDFKIIDEKREIVPICGTNIRKHPLKYWDFIHPVCKEFFMKKIAIVGGESCGKSTMTKLLARAFNSVFVEEYGRDYVESLQRHKDYSEYVWSDDDFDYIAKTQIDDENEAIANAKGSKFLFCDTDPITTQCFNYLYLGSFSSKVEKRIKNYKQPDMYFLLNPDVDFYNDGTREFENQRQKQFELLETQLKANNCNYIVITGDDFDKRFKKVVDFIKKLYL